MLRNYHGDFNVSKLPSLHDEPMATCQHCGASYHARWRWVDGMWEIRDAIDDMKGVPGYKGHEYFCAVAMSKGSDA